MRVETTFKDFSHRFQIASSSKIIYRSVGIINVKNEPGIIIFVVVGYKNVTDVLNVHKYWYKSV